MSLFNHVFGSYCILLQSLSSCMDSEEEIARREALVEEETRILEELKRIKLTEHDLSLLKNLTKANENQVAAPKANLSLSTVTSLPDVAFNVPPPSTSGSGADKSNPQARSRKYLADVLGEGGFVEDDPTEIETDSEFATDSEVAPDETDELNPKDLVARIALRDDTWCTNRSVNAIRYHTKHDGILLTAHGKCTGECTNPSGVINIWRLDVAEASLQRTLIAHDAVTAMVLPSISPTSVIGATYGGEVLMWDLRAKASTPAQRSGMRNPDPHFGHDRSPVYSLEMGNGKGELVSASANGTVCIWSVSKLAAPLSRFSVRNDQMQTVRTTSLGVPTGKKMMARDNIASQYYFVGAEDGGVYKFELRDGNWKIGAHVKNHIAPVTAMSVHPTSRKWPLVNDIVLSASMDWTVKLSKMGTNLKDSQGRKFRTITPGIIGDVQWSPVHPRIFAFGDEAGNVSLMDVEKCTNPARKCCTHTIAQNPDAVGSTPAINRVRWSKDGCLLAAGDIAGGLAVWRCSEKVYDSSAAQWERMTNFLKELD